MQAVVAADAVVREAEAVCLHTSSMMAAAVAMYERLGFRRCPDYDWELDKLIPFEATGPRIIATAYSFHL